MKNDLRFSLWQELILCCLLLILGINSGHAGENYEIRFGSVAMDVPMEMHRRLEPLADYLSREINQPVILSLVPDMETVIKQLANGEIDLAYLTPVAYIESNRKARTKLIVRTVTGGKPEFQLMIVVKEESDIKNINELKGKTFAFGDRAAILQRAIVEQSGISLAQLGSYEFLGHYDNIVKGILIGDFDAGIVKDTTALAWHKKGLRILYSSPPLPPYNITASPRMNDRLISDIRKALLKLELSRPDDRVVIKALDPLYDGFAPATDKDYDVVRKVINHYKVLMKIQN